MTPCVMWQPAAISPIWTVILPLPSTARPTRPCLPRCYSLALSTCGCRIVCQLMRPGHIRGSGRRAGPCAGGACRSLRSKQSRRVLAIRLSAIAFARSAWTGVLRIRTPTAVKTASNAAVNLVSRSRITNRRFERSSERFRACWITHPAIGFAVIPATRTNRESWSIKKST